MSGQAYVLLHCAQSRQVMTARFVEEGGWWNLAEAFPGGGGGSRAEASGLTGQFGLAPGYPGCPGCRNPGYVRCGSCQELSCWLGSGQFACGACGNRGVVSGGIDNVRVDDFG